MQMCNLVEIQMDWNRAKSPDEKHKNIAIVANEDDFIWWQIGLISRISQPLS